MFDYKYSHITGITAKELTENQFLEWVAPVSLTTGELNPNTYREKHLHKKRVEKLAVFNDCLFIITKWGQIEFQGSLHQYIRTTNHDDFTLPQLFEVIRELHEKFSINPFNDFLHNIEFGVNVHIPVSAKEFLNSIVSFKGKEYNRHDFKKNSQQITFKFRQYEFKLYTKGLQYGLHESLLRVEIKVRRMAFLHSKRIPLRTSADLLNKTVHERLGMVLTDFFSQLIVHDPQIKIERLNKREQTLLRDGRNPKHWPTLKTKTYQKKRKRFRELIKRHSKTNIQETILKLITEKWRQLSATDPETDNQIQNFLNNFNKENVPVFTESNHPVYSPPEKSKCTSFYPYTYSQNSTIPNSERKCLSCGRDISKQRPGSKFCSERLYGRSAKQCRNNDSNPRNNFLRRERKIEARGLLFNPDHLLIGNFAQLKKTIENNAVH